MSHSPPGRLIELIERLELATADNVRGVARRVGRLAGDLPQFESVWTDALVAANILTPLQATEINAGRAESLRVGPFLLCSRVAGPTYGTCYRARRAESGETVRLTVTQANGRPGTGLVGKLDGLVAAADRLRCEHTLPITEAGADTERIWVASPWFDGRTMAEWMVRHGRVKPTTVLEIARAMARALVTIEAAGFCHGDVSTATLLLPKTGGVVLTEPGFRAIVRPEEGFAHANLPPEAYDSLAPERITDGTPPSTAADIYACGCVWWHMLCGRPPLVGGDSLGKLRAAQTANVFDVRRLATDVPTELEATMSACLDPVPRQRPGSMRSLAAMLGGAPQGPRPGVLRGLLNPAEQDLLARRLQPARAARQRRARRRSSPGRMRRPTMGRVAVTGGVAVVAAMVWPLVRSENEPVSAPAPATQQVAASDPANARPSDPNSVLPAGGGQATGLLIDPAVIPTRFEQPVSFPGTTTAGPADLILPSDGSQRLDSIHLEAGQRVRAPTGERLQVLVPFTGLEIEAEGVRFEDIDFVWSHHELEDSKDGVRQALIHLRGGNVEFLRCTFRSISSLSHPPAAIVWDYPVDPAEAALSLPSGRVRLAACVLEDVQTGIDCRTIGSLTVEISNTLKLGGGPMLRLDHLPRPDEPLSLILERITLRAGGPLLACRCGAMSDETGEMAIEADGCVFAPSSGEALLVLSGPEPPEPVLPKIRWTGQGSLVSPDVPIVAWRAADGKDHVADETAVSIDGLVRSDVGFAGEIAEGPSASRTVRWQAPLRSTASPGIDPSLFLDDRGQGPSPEF